MLRRLIISGIAGCFCLCLLFLENKCSYFLGTQELVAEVKPADTANTPETTPDAPKVYDILFKDVAGNVLAPDPSDIAELKARLAGNPGRDQQPIPLSGEIQVQGVTAIVRVAPGGADEDTLRSRLAAAGFRRPNPPRPLFHLTKGIDLRGGVEFVCRLHREDGRPVPADDEVVHILRNRLDERGLTEPQVTRLSSGDVQVVIPGGTPADAARTRKVLETTGRLEFCHVIDPYLDDSSFRRYTIDVSPHDATPAVIKNEKGQWDINPARDDLRRRNRNEIVAQDHEHPQRFYLLGRPELVGSDVSNASQTIEQGQLAVAIEFTAIGGAKNETFTRQAKDEQGQPPAIAPTGTGHIAILFDGEVRSAPIVISPSTSSCLISGQFTPEEIESLRSVLRGGSLSVTPVVLSERVVGATLGEQTVFRSLMSMGVTAALIVAFMWLYYRRLGTVANLCLLCTTFFIWGVLSIFDATITLPGLAGLVLTIGMAVDTNILIFERIREELAEDKGLKAAIAAGYDRAFLTIVDAHLTTFITAFILYWIGTGPVKGFGLTLMIGIVVNLFSGVYIGRLLTDLFSRRLSSLSMASWIPVLKLPYVEWRWVGYTVSIVTGLFGLSWFVFGHFALGGTFQRNFDIDFTGGNAAQVVFREPMTQSQVDASIQAAWDKDRAAFNLLAPSELRKQPYFAALSGDHHASREWVFRARDEEGTRLEAVRNDLERSRAGIEKQIEDLRADHGMQNPEAKKMEKEQLKPLDGRIHELAEQVSSRSEAFKNQLAKAFVGEVGQDGDEILAASVAGQSINLTLAVLEPIDNNQLAGIGEKLADPTRYKTVTPHYQANPPALTVTASLLAPPQPQHENPAQDKISARIDALLGSDPAARGDELIGRERAVQDLYTAAANAAATRRVTVAKPFPSSEHFSGQVAGQMQVRALAAVLLSLLAILAYVAARFEFRFGIGAVVALVHDVALTVGLVSLFGIRIDLTVIAALLTIIGYSINDTIVTFDRIRENLRKLAKPLAEVIDLSIAQVMPRTVLTTGTVLLTVVVLFFFGGDALHAFTATLLIGLISGTYSSVFVASPLLLSFKGRLVEPEVSADGSGGTSPAVPGGGALNGAQTQAR